MSKKPASNTPASHAEELRMVEDQWMGKDAPRTADGKVERGHGSFWAQLTPERKKHHAALEAAVATQKHLDVTAASHEAAKAAHGAAAKRVAETWTN